MGRMGLAAVGGRRSWDRANLLLRCTPGYRTAKGGITAPGASRRGVSTDGKELRHLRARDGTEAVGLAGGDRAVGPAHPSSHVGPAADQGEEAVGGRVGVAAIAEEGVAAGLEIRDLWREGHTVEATVRVASSRPASCTLVLHTEEKGEFRRIPMSAIGPYTHHAVFQPPTGRNSSLWASAEVTVAGETTVVPGNRPPSRVGPVPAADILGRLAGDLPALPVKGDPLLLNGKQAGYVTSALRSGKYHANIALGYVHRDANPLGTELRLRTEHGESPAKVSCLPFAPAWS